LVTHGTVSRAAVGQALLPVNGHTYL